MPVSASAATTGAIFMKLGRAPATHKTWVMENLLMGDILPVGQRTFVSDCVAAFAHGEENLAHDGQDAVDRALHLIDALHQNDFSPRGSRTAAGGHRWC